MQGNQVGFESSLQQHLDTEQRRAVLEAIGGSINPDSTLGEIIDAAEALGWSEKMGDLSLADLAEALLAPNGESATVSEAAAVDDDGDDDEAAADDSDEDEDEDESDDEDEDDDFELEIEEPAPSRRKPGKAAAAAAAKEAKSAATKKKLAAASKKAASKKAAELEPMRGKKTAKKLPQPAEPARGKKSAKKLPEPPAPARSGRGSEKAASPAPSKKASKKAAAATGRRKPTAVDVDDRMSLDEASDFFLPVVEELGEATMQALEEQTGVSRRKLRFHVGQLVKHGYLERHGMGRGTYYTRR